MRLFLLAAMIMGCCIGSFHLLNHVALAWEPRASDQLSKISSVKSITRSGTSPRAESAEADYDPKPLTTYSIIVKRPIFFIDRRYPRKKIVAKRIIKPKPVARPAKPKPPASLKGKLHGVLLWDAAPRALLSTDGREPRWYALGDQLGRWKIDAIQANTVRLRQNRITVELKLHSSPH